MRLSALVGRRERNIPSSSSAPLAACRASLFLAEPTLHPLHIGVGERGNLRLWDGEAQRTDGHLHTFAVSVAGPAISWRRSSASRWPTSSGEVVCMSR